MTTRTVYWDEEAGEQRERDLTPAEESALRAEIAADAAAIVRSDMDAYLSEVRALRERLLNRIAGIATAALAARDQETVDAFMAARQRLLDITKIPAAASAVTLEELQSAVKGEYIRIVLSVPANLKNAFDKVDQ